LEVEAEAVEAITEAVAVVALGLKQV